MASVSDSIDVPLSPDDAWAAACDLSRYEEWLTIHDGWRSDLPAPEDLKKGLKVSSVVKTKGARVRFEWTLDSYDPPNGLLLKGTGKGGVKSKLGLSVKPKGDGATVTFDLELGGMVMIGPAGKAAAKAVQGDLRDSLENFKEIFS